MDLVSSLSGLMEEHTCPCTFAEDDLMYMLAVVASHPQSTIEFSASNIVSKRPELVPAERAVLNAVEDFVDGRQKPHVPAAASKLPAPAATSPNLPSTTPSQPSNLATPHTSDLPSSSSGQEKSKSQIKREKKRKKKDAEATAQHDVADQQQNGEAAASATDEAASTSAGMHHAQV